MEITNSGNLQVRTHENGVQEFLEAPLSMSLFNDFEDRLLTRHTDGRYVFRDDRGNVLIYMSTGLSALDGFQRVGLELKSYYDVERNLYQTAFPPLSLTMSDVLVPNRLLQELTFVPTEEPFVYKRTAGPFGFPVLDLFGQLADSIPLEDAVTAAPGYLSGEPTEQEPVTAGSLSNADGSFKIDLDEGAIEISESQNSLTRVSVHYDDRRDLVFVGYDVLDHIDDDGGALALEIDGKAIVPAFGWTHYTFEALDNPLVDEEAPLASVAKERISDPICEGPVFPDGSFTKDQIEEAFRFLVADKLTDRKAA
jgi:hypothetical protein